MKKPLVISNNGLIEERSRGDSPLIPFVFFDHFVGNLNNIFGTANNGAGGAGTTANADCVQGQFGAIRLRAGNPANGGNLIHTGVNTFRVSNLYGFRYIFGAALPVLSNGTNRYNLRSGIKLTPTAFGDGTGFYIRYSDNVNAGNFQGVFRNGATETTLDLGFAPVANEPFLVGFEISQNYSTISFFNIDINGNKIDRGFLTLSGGSLPTLNTIMGAFTSIQKSVGASTIDCLQDFIHCEVF